MLEVKMPLWLSQVIISSLSFLIQFKIYLNSETNSLKNLILISVVEPIQNSIPSFPPKNGEKRFVKEVAIVLFVFKEQARYSLFIT